MMMDDDATQSKMNEIGAEVQAWLDENGRVMVCDFCAHKLDLDTAVTFGTGTPIEGELSALDDNLGTGSLEMVWSSDWAACPNCAPVVREGDPEKLADHALQNRDIERVGPIPLAALAVVRADLVDLYGEFFRRNPQEVPNPVSKEVA